METLQFDRLLIKTAFSCMASDGHIDKTEVETIKSLCESSHLFSGFDFQSEINAMINRLNKEGRGFIDFYFNALEKTELSEEQELLIIDFALKTIHADDKVDYAEIKFFKMIRSKLKVSDEDILEKHPGIEQFLEEDLVIESFSTKLNKYLTTVNLPQFAHIDLSENR